MNGDRHFQASKKWSYYNLLICHLLNKYVIKINREFFYLQMKWAFRLPSSSALAGKQVERVQVSGFEPVTSQWSGPFPVKPEVDQAGTFNRSPIQLGPQKWESSNSL